MALKTRTVFSKWSCLPLVAVVVLAAWGCKKPTTAPTSESDRATKPLASTAAATPDEDDPSNWTPAQKMAFLQKKCDEGDGDGCYYLGDHYKNGEGVPTDKPKAAGLYQKACDAGNADACVSLYFMWKKGDAGAVNYDKAMTLLAAACNRANSSGCYLFGLEGLLVDDPEARRVGLAYIKKACQLGDDDACKSAAEHEGAARSGGGRGSPGSGSGKPVSVRSAGIEWVVMPELAGKLVVKKASCDVRAASGIQACDVTVVVPDGWDASSDRMSTITFDADGTRTGQFAKGHYLDGTPPGGSVRLRFATMGIDTAKAVFAQE